MTNHNNAAQAAEQEIREAFELTYAANADDPACASDLSHFTNGWRACVMSKLRAPLADERGLLPCPFCGSEAFETFKTDDDGIRRHSVHCKDLNCGGQTRDRHFSEAKAIAAWNRRTVAAPQASAEYERGHADGWAAGWGQALKQPQADKDGGQQRAGDAERWRWATATDENAQVLYTIVQAYGGDQKKINERADFYRAALSATQAGQGERDE